MTTDKTLGSAVPGTTTKKFAAATGQSDSPSAMLGVWANQLSQRPTSPTMTQSEISGNLAHVDKLAGTAAWAAKVVSYIPGDKNLSGKLSGAAAQLREAEKLEEAMAPYLAGHTPRQGYALFLADSANKDPQIGAINPDPALVKQAAEMLTKQGITDDPQQSVATGLARMSIFTSDTTRNIENTLATDIDALGKALSAPPAGSAPKPAAPKS